MKKIMILLMTCFLLACGSTPVKEPTPFTPRADSPKVRPEGCDALIKEIKAQNKKNGTNIVPDC